MKYIFLSLLLLFGSPTVFSQTDAKRAPEGFDSLHPEIPHGKIDTVSYSSKTVGSVRKALIYTPSRISKSKKYPVVYLLHGIGGDEKECVNNGQHHLIRDNLYAEKTLQ